MGAITGGLQEHAQPQLLQESGGSANKGSFKLRLNIPKPRKDKAQKQKANSALPGEEGPGLPADPPPAAPQGVGVHPFCTSITNAPFGGDFSPGSPALVATPVCGEAQPRVVLAKGRRLGAPNPLQPEQGQWGRGGAACPLFYLSGFPPRQRTSGALRRWLHGWKRWVWASTETFSSGTTSRAPS